jgi:hypothetical protein
MKKFIRNSLISLLVAGSATGAALFIGVNAGLIAGTTAVEAAGLNATLLAGIFSATTAVSMAGSYIFGRKAAADAKVESDMQVATVEADANANPGLISRFANTLSHAPSATLSGIKNTANGIYNSLPSFRSKEEEAAIPKELTNTLDGEKNKPATGKRQRRQTQRYGFDA